MSNMKKLFYILALVSVHAVSSLDICPSGCRCSPAPSVHSRHRWHRLLAAYRMRQLVYGHDESGVLMDVKSLSHPPGRHMTCFGLDNVPEHVPKDISKVTFYGDARKDSRNSLRDSPQGGANIHYISSDTSSKSRQLTHVGQYGLAGTSMEVLSIEGNQLKSLHPDEFSMLRNLKKLFLKNNGIRLIERGALNGLNRLSDLDLSQNRLKALPKTTFINTTALSKLSIAQNNIRGLSHNLLKKLRSLNILDMSDNLLRDLAADFFQTNGELKEINLANNNFEAIKVQWFSDLKNISKLILTGNQIHHIPEDLLLSLSHLYVLDLGRNVIDYLSREMFGNMDNLHTLSLANNNISHISSGTFSSITALKYLHLEGNSIRLLSDGAFEGLTSLRELDLSSNKLLEINKKAIAELKHMQRLDLSKNYIKIIYTHNFYGLNELRELRLDHNSIKGIQDEGLAVSRMNQYSKITWLYLNDNKISAIPRKMLYGLYYVKFLNLGQNDIRAVDDGALTYTNRLNTLILQDNKIERLHVAVFKHLRHVHHLNLASNQLRHIGLNVFLGLKTLEHLNLQNNQLEEITSEPFMETPRLKSLNMRGNRIRVADLNFLETAYGLKYLDISRNRISTVVMPKTFHKALYKFSLSDNHISKLSEDTTKLMSKGASLHLYGNPWSCDCRLAWLPHVTTNAGIRLDKEKELVCKTPMSLSGSKIIGLNEKDFMCSESPERELDSDFTLVQTPDVMRDITRSRASTECDFTNEALKGFTRNEIKASKYSVYDWYTTILDNRRNLLCAGVQISNDWVLSSSSCWKNFTGYANVLISIGSTYSSNDMREAVIEKVIHHTGNFNVALVKITRKMGAGPIQEFPCILSRDGNENAKQYGVHGIILALFSGENQIFRKVKLRSLPFKVSKVGCPPGHVCLKGNKERLSGSGWPTQGAPLFVRIDSRWALVGLALGAHSQDARSYRFGHRVIVPLHPIAQWVEETIQRE